MKIMSFQLVRVKISLAKKDKSSHFKGENLVRLSVIPIKFSFYNLVLNILFILQLCNINKIFPIFQKSLILDFS